MATIAVMTVSDGRPYVHLEIESFGLGVQQRIVRALGGLGHRVVTAASDIHSNATAVAVARELAAARPDLTIVNVPVWAFPHFTMLAVRETPGAVVLFSTIDPQYPGMVGMLRRPAVAWTRSGGSTNGCGATSRTSRCSAGSTPSPAPGRRPAGCVARRSAGSAAARWACTPRCPPPTSGCRSSALTSRR